MNPLLSGRLYPASLMAVALALSCFAQVSLRSRETFRDFPVAKMDSILDSP